MQISILTTGDQMKKSMKFIFPDFKKDIIKLITPIIPKNF